MYAKMKELGPVGGACARHAAPDLPMNMNMHSEDITSKIISGQTSNFLGEEGGGLLLFVVVSC